MSLSVSPRSLDIPGVFELSSPKFVDARGVFMKVAQASGLAAVGLRANFQEAFVTISGPGVLRGMHLQLPPAAHAKLVQCVTGSMLDVVLDLRCGSPTYGRAASLLLSPGAAVYLPEGIAHGFCTLEAPCTVMYLTTSEHYPELDTGVRWDSFGFSWPVTMPLLSERDARLVPFAEFHSPFIYV